MKPAILLAFLVASSWMYPDTARALFEAEATFASFYDKGWSDLLIWGGVGVLVAAAFGAAVFFTGGAASPVVAPGAVALGTLIGNFMGLTGVAATNAGLALVGGGAIAAGGLGIAGGAAVITAASSVAFDAAVIAGEELYDSAKEKRETDALYARLVNHSERLITFPLPRSNSGSKALKEAMSILGDIDDKLPLSVEDNGLLIRKAISELRWSPDDRENALAALAHIDKGEPLSSGRNQESAMKAVDILLESSETTDLRDAALLSLLYFVLNDYRKANHYAERAREIAQAEDPEGYAARITLPTFISATCSLYDREADYATAISQFKSSILTEPESKLVPLLFSIFLDRFTLRSMNDGHLNPQVFHETFEIMKLPSLAEFRLTNYIILLGRYLIHIENERLKIRSLTGASDSTIREHPKTLSYVKNALDAYRLLLRGVSDVESNIVVLALDELNEVQREAIARLRGQYTRAILEKEELALLVKDLERRRAEE